MELCVALIELRDGRGGIGVGLEGLEGLMGLASENQGFVAKWRIWRNQQISNGHEYATTVMAMVWW